MQEAGVPPTDPALDPSDPVPNRAGGKPTVGQVVADHLTVDAAPNARRALREMDAIDRAIYGAVARTASPTIDAGLRRLSNSANYSRLWVGAAAALSVVGGRSGRRAAGVGLTAIALTSAAVNVGVKPLFERSRPDRHAVDVPTLRLVRMPTSTSFPSGHSASAFAFAHAVAGELPLLGLPLRLLATAVAYSRVHTGVHYPGDVVVGSIIGAVVGELTSDIARLLRAAGHAG
jgi:undecaprenyl-diphosphatase